MVAQATAGVLYVALAFVSFGSFAVPIKSPSLAKLDVDPIVYQSFKASACFLLYWLVLIWEPFEFTWYGLAGAAVWVPSGVTAVAAVRLSGLAVAQGLWSSVATVVSFSWGAIVFGEKPKNLGLSLLAIALIVCGCVGMAYASDRGLKEARLSGTSAGQERVRSAAASADGEGTAAEPAEALRDRSVSKDGAEAPLLRASTAAAADGPAAAAAAGLEVDGRARGHRQFVAGLLLAIFTGVCGGSNYVPVHYAGAKAQGNGYLVSFGIGALVVNVAFVLLYIMFRASTGKAPLPPLHLQQLTVPGLLTGALWSLGNFASVNATITLGQAVGGTVVQGNLIIAGLWAVLYYREMRSAGVIATWFASAALALAGVVLLLIFG